MDAAYINQEFYYNPPFLWNKLTETGSDCQQFHLLAAIYCQ